ncbi:PREDICTED: putative F-box protein At5g41510 [Camelina sativa]|uniref:F-box protein At5g41510 n=1 Tax=Camelina sativa TaxID=90675 RepID=A0ABM1RL80_CAMSA|nr:PREDICTED: putative F-box protein At5g41510 [Camelina sativa]
MTTMISDLPMDLIKEIISRLPMKSVRLTCKSWNDLSKSEIGKVTRRPTREGETMMIAVMRHKLYLMSGFFDGVDPSIEQRGRLRFLCNHINIYRVYHYEGLLLCILKDVTRIVVWNPYWGQTRWIKLKYTHCPQGDDMFNYSLGYEDKESCRSLKLLWFVDFFHRAPEEQFLLYEIYDFDTGLWTTLEVAPHWRIYCSRSSVSLKGNSYWCASERSCSEGGNDHIICFDFTRERFGPLLALPSCVRDREYEHVNLSCVKEEKIAALFLYEYASEFEIWITTTIKAEMVSWSKFLRIHTGPRINFPDCFFIEEEKKVFLCVGRHHDYPKTFIDIIGEAGDF